MKKCVYCKRELAEESVIDVCNICGKGVWGEKMFNTIVKSMEDANDRGSLMQGSVGSDKPGKVKSS
jgi:hypothetical protein